MPNFLLLVRAYLDCRKRKRNTFNALRFEFYQEDNIRELHSQLLSEKYNIGKSICFLVFQPKIREIWAADFRDRVVHHLVYNEISELFYNRFTKDTYSCIPKRGSTNAIKTLDGYIKAITHNYQRSAYYLKADIENFFVSINKDILYREVTKLVDKEWVLKLLSQIIYHDCRKKVTVQTTKSSFKKLPKYKSLWYAPDNKGLPIGNLTSQFFSNVYLNVMDQYVKHHWRCKYYCRYVDDFVILDTDPQKLNEIHNDLTRFLKKRLDLNLHQNKKSINKTERGIDFVGFVQKPYRCVMRQKTLKKVFRKIREFKASPTWYESMQDYVNSINSYLGMLRNTNGYKLRKKICCMSINLFIGCDEDFTKLFVRKK
ncbi:RNA-directed DNA polymerase [bacterium]|nr:RNA-directed DNA polymerase [bacterium]